MTGQPTPRPDGPTAPTSPKPPAPPAGPSTAPARPIWQGQAGWLGADSLHLHQLRARGRPVLTALPGTPTASPPPELAPGQHPGGLTPRRLTLLAALTVAGVAAASLLGLPWWVQALLGTGAVLTYLAWPAVRQVRAISRWARREEAVTLLLGATGAAPTPPGPADFQRSVTVRTVSPSDSPGELPSGPEVALVIYGLSPAERAQLVRQVLGHQALSRSRQLTPRQRR